MTTLMEIVEGCENFLGWRPHDPRMPMWKARSIEIAKLKHAMTIHCSRQPVTLRQLALALEYSRRRRLPLSSPVFLLDRIEQAEALAYTPPGTSDVDAAVNTAIRWEQGHDDPDSLRWIHRLVRSIGPGREQTLADWKTDGRG